MIKKAISIAVIAAMICISAVSGVSGVSGVNAAKKAGLKTKTVKLKVGQKKTIKISNKAKKAKYKFSSSRKKVAAVSKKGVITAKKSGTAKVTVKETLKKKTRTLGKVTVKVSKAETPQTTQAVTQTQQPVSPTQPAIQTPQPKPTDEPTATPTKNPYIPVSELLEDDTLYTPKGYQSVNSDVAGTSEEITYPSTVIIEGQDFNRNAWVCLPKGYNEPENADKKYPVIYMNHGIFGNHHALYNDKTQNVLWNAVANGDAEEAILVFGHCCANETGNDGGLGFNLEHYAAYDNFFNDLTQCLMPYIEENYRVLTGRENTAVCGFSMGGRVSLHCGFAAQDKFRYIGAFCPAPGILDFSDNGVTGPGLFTYEGFTLNDEYFDDTFVQIVKGPNDGVVKHFPLEYHERLVTNGVPHFYYETMGGENENGDGGHSAAVYKHGFYNFLCRIFKKSE